MFRLLLVCACLVGALGASGATVNIALLPTATESLVNFHKEGYHMFHGEMTVGTPPQKMRVVFETASGLTYVPSLKCEDPACLIRHRYNSAASSTYKANGTPFDIGYGQNTSGFLSTDTVSIAGLSIKSQTFGEATSEWNQYALKFPNDGLVGLGFSSTATEKTPTPLDSMVSEGLIPRRQFGIWLNESGGELTLGGVNQHRFSGHLTTVDLVTPNTSWAFKTGRINVGNLRLCDDGCYAFMVTGTPYFLVSYESAKTINNRLGAKEVFTTGFYVLDCTTLYKLPTLTIRIAGREFSMSPYDYTIINNFPGGLQMCASGILGSPYMKGSMFSLGTLFMQKFYALYDMDANTIGFADSVSNTPANTKGFADSVSNTLSLS